MYAARRAAERYWASVKPRGSSTKPAISTPTDSLLTRQLPACQAMSDWWTSWTIRPLRDTM